MSNKAISVYAEAIKRQHEEAQEPSPPRAMPSQQSPTISSSSKRETHSQPAKLSAGTPNNSPQHEKDKTLQQERNLQANNQASKLASKQAFIHSFLEQKATDTVTFRFPRDLLEKLEEVHYLVRKRSGSKITRNSIIVASLAASLWDLEKDHDDSMVHKLLGEKQA